MPLLSLEPQLLTNEGISLGKLTNYLPVTVKIYLLPQLTVASEDLLAIEIFHG